MSHQVIANLKSELMNLQPHLEGQQFRLRPMAENDFEALYLKASDPLIWEQHSQPTRYQRDVFQTYFDSGMASGGAFVIEDRKTGEIVGSSRYYDYLPSERSVKIGFTFIARNYWGGDFNKELKEVMLEYAFQSVDRVMFDVGSENWRSRKALEKLGAKVLSEKLKVTPEGRTITSVTYVIDKP